MSPTLVQSKSGTITSGTSLTITLTSATTAGNCLVVAVGGTQSSTNPSVTGVTIGGSADNFAKAKSVNVAGDADAEAWVDPNCVGSQTSVVITFAAGSGTSQGCGAWVMEWSGLASAPTDKTNSGTGGTSSWSSGASGTLTQASEVVIGCVMSFTSGGSLSTPTSPWTELGTLTAGTGNNFAAGYQIVSATTSLTYNSTLSGGAQAWAAVIVSLEASTLVTGTGGFGLGGLGFSGTASVSGGSFGLGGLRFSGAGALTFSGSGGLALGGLGFSGTQTTVAPVIPTEPAGVIATSKDLNEWATASQFFLGSFRGTQPVFFLMAAATQSLTTSFTAVTYSSSAPVFKDNNGAWTSGTPSRMTVMTPGFYSIAWSVSAASGAGHLQCYAQVTTTAANPFNPSATMKFQAANRAATTNITVTSSGGLVPIYLATGDYIEVYALVGSAVSTSLTFAPQISGEWVSD